jgi:hypothetical protein
MKTELIKIIEDHSKMQDVIFDIRNYLDGDGELPNTLPSFNDETTYNNLSYILEKLADKC